MPSFTDPASRLFALLDEVEPEYQRRFLAAIGQMRGQTSLAEVARQIEVGDFQAALDAAEAGAKRVASISRAAFVRAGESTAEFIGTKIGAVFDFDAVHSRAISYLQADSLRLVREFSAEQYGATRHALEEGVRRGLNPRAQARLFRDSLGLTERQMRAVTNYRTMLEEGSYDALRRKLRDRRFDRTVRAALEGRRPLTRAQIDTMVGRYHDRYLILRSETIARSEALRSVHAGNQEVYAQAMDEGKVKDVRQTWVPANDDRVRDTHDAMRGQVQVYGDFFVSGAGNKLRYPGDPEAPASETIACRCALATRAEVA